MHRQCSHTWDQCSRNPVNGGDAIVDAHGNFTGTFAGNNQNQQGSYHNPNQGQSQGNDNGNNGPPQKRKFRSPLGN